MRAYSKNCDYFKDVYWQFPENLGRRSINCSDLINYPTLIQTKLEIIRLWMRQWQRYACDFQDKDEEAIEAFRFLISAYTGKLEDDIEVSLYVSQDEKEGILKLFREYTDSSFTPEIAEKWLKQPNVPEEIRKIFRMAWIRNGGQELFDRCMKNAELLKPLDVENRSEAELEFCQKFFRELEKVGGRVQKLIKELKEGPCLKAEKFEAIFHKLDDITLHIHYKKEDLISDSVVRKFIQDIRSFVSQCKSGRYAEIWFILWGDQAQRDHVANFKEMVYFGP